MKTFRAVLALDLDFTIARRFCIKRRRQASATASAAALVTLDAGLSVDLRKRPDALRAGRDS